MILPLMRGALEAMALRGTPRALTGPVARGDAATVAAHLEALKGERSSSRSTLPARAALALFVPSWTLRIVWRWPRSCRDLARRLPSRDRTSDRRACPGREAEPWART